MTDDGLDTLTGITDAPGAEKKPSRKKKEPEPEPVYTERVTDFEKQGLGYRLWSEAIGTELRASHLKRSSGVLECDISISTTMPGIKTVDGKLHIARFNMTSSAARTSLTKSLEKRAPGIDIDWGILLEELCQRTITAELEGEPIIKVGNNPSLKIMGSYALDPLVPRNVSALFYGPGGAGKSVTSLAGALSIATGVEILPGVSPAIRGPVLYLDWETDGHVVNDRIQAIAKGHNIRPVDIHYRRCRRPLAADAEETAGFVEREGIVYLVIDSAGMAMGATREYGDANESTLRLFEAVRFINVSTQIIDHVAKAELRLAGKVRGLSPYGSVYKVNMARAAWELRNATSPEDDHLRILLIHAKANDSRLLAPIPLRINWSPDRIQFLPDVMPDEERETGGLPATLMNKLLTFLDEAEEPMLPGEIAIGAGMNPGTVKRYLVRMTERGMTKHEGHKYSRIAPPRIHPEAQYEDPMDSGDTQ